MFYVAVLCQKDLRATLLKFGMTVYVSAVKVEVLLARFFLNVGAKPTI